MRILTEFERIGDLALRGVKLEPRVEDCRRRARRGTWCSRSSTWPSSSTAWPCGPGRRRTCTLATELATNRPSFASYHERLVIEMRTFAGPDAVPLAMAIYAAGHAADRIADHAAIIGARLRYLITGDPEHLAAEVRGP